jgi:hypothetical protein
MKRWSRRDFLKLAGLGAGVVATGGVVATRGALSGLLASPSPGATAPIVRALRHIPKLTAADPPPADDEYDLLFAPNPISRDQVVRDFGLLRSSSAHQVPPSTMASYVNGYSWRNAVGANNTATSDASIWPFDGALPTDQFTIVFYIRSKGADYVQQPATRTSYHWFFDVDGYGYNGLYAFRSMSSPASMRLRWQFEPLQLEAVLNLMTGDIPSDTWKRIVCVWDGLSLSIATGDNARHSASPAISSVAGIHLGHSLAENVALPASCSLLGGLSGGLFVNGGGVVPANSGGPFEIEGPYVYRYQRSFSTATAVAGRSIAVDASSTDRLFPSDVGGVLNQYSGLVSLGNASRDQNIAGRNAVISKAARGGLKTIRFPDLTSYVRFTYTQGGSNNGVSGYDWTDFDSRVNLWKSRGISRFHADFLGTPEPIQPGPFPFRPTAPIGFRSTVIAAPVRTTPMKIGTALFIYEGSQSETVFLTADYPGGPGPISISATSAGYGDAAAVNIGIFTGGSGNAMFAPAVDNDAWGQVCADVVARLINVLGITVVHLGFWNEPLSANHYGGTRAAYVAQWLAAAQKINSDNRIAASGVKLGAGEPSLWIPTDTSGSDSETGWQKAIVEQASASGLPMPALSYHSYTGNLNVERRAIQDQHAYMRARGFANAKVHIGEWNMDVGAASQVDDATTAGAMHPDSWGNEYLAAYAHAFIYEMMAGGVEDMIFTRLQQSDITRSESRLHLYSSGNPASPFGVGTYFEMLWKIPVGATMFSCVSNWPDVRAFGARLGDRLTILYGRYRPWRGQSDSAVQVDFDWSNLPARFSWKQWQVDHTTVGDNALKQVGGGNQGNLPGSVSLLPLSAGCVQIVG